MMPRFVNTGASVGLRFAALIVVGGLAYIIGMMASSALLGFLLALVALTASNLFLRKKYAFKAFPHEIEGSSADFWGRFQVAYFLIAGIIGTYFALTIEPLEFALTFAMAGAFTLAEVLAKFVSDRTRSRLIQ